ncbi:CoA pyrophosphatase [Facklamia sp. DSM 111018]|uniref:CoA pyrophosphatase n=1 Tax=Facklamia lactis TaxID=2749967 RepID=A0ABS0LSG8_9LACT|nr:CoA pyrophosphatase [Facklamia lactis]MBG9981416.1 CoA pyrophosphatase [Facklamia lactis]MBG9987108.1 CoA pyrophosphatase [Facklamia lactis]
MKFKESVFRKIIRDYLPEPIRKPCQYSVLLPLVFHQDEWHVLYEVRSSNISQPGDTSFPGGRIESNESSEEAAVRECCEELMISKEKIEVIGQIDYIVNERVIVYCFVGIIHDIEVNKIGPNDLEVDYVFTLPLNYLLANEPTYYNATTITKTIEGFPYHLMAHGKNYNFRSTNREIPFYDLPNGEFLWGYTANMTHRFIEILRGYSK